MKIPVTIAEIRQETPTVKSFNFDLMGQEFNFRSGQWIDCFVEIEGATGVAGYSMTSSPSITDSFEIAVKLVGDNLVTHMMHNEAKAGDQIFVDGGHGDFFYENGMGDSLVLIAGGIGLTPLMSIIRYVDEDASNAQLTLLYSASTNEEILFHNQLTEMAARNPRIRCEFTVTQPVERTWAGRSGRIDPAMLFDAGVDMGALFYVCGPPGMIQGMIAMLDTLGVPESRIKYEQWW